MNDIAERIYKIAGKITVKAATKKDEMWDEILEVMKRHNRLDVECMVDLFAEVWNGGLEQWVGNGHADELRMIVMMGKRMGPVGQQIASKLTQLTKEIAEVDRWLNKGGFRDSDGEDVPYSDEMDDFDKWFYTIDDRAVAELHAFAVQ